MHSSYIDGKSIDLLERHAQPLRAVSSDCDKLIHATRGKKFVLLGEASHGTAEFYRTRAEITRRLIEEEGFDAVAVEADWPDAYRVNRFVARTSDDVDADEALSDFQRFPTWMWRNMEVKDFIDGCGFQ
jgi:erythromycin esterase-like protein